MHVYSTEGHSQSILPGHIYIADWIVDWIVDWIADWIADWIVDWIADWIVDWIAGDWIVDWIAGDWITGFNLLISHDLHPISCVKIGYFDCLMLFIIPENVHA